MTKKIFLLIFSLMVCVSLCQAEVHLRTGIRTLVSFLPYALIAFLSSVVGRICGMGGGILIKPVMDAIVNINVEAISFLSGVTVLSMAFWTFLKNRKDGGFRNDARTKFIGCGAVFGGIGGKYLFNLINRYVGHVNTIVIVQSLMLIVLTVLVLIYSLLFGKLKKYNISRKDYSVGIGLLLGLISSFLGIGGGPINVILLSQFFSMDMKTAASNSLFIILLSQSASLIQVVITSSIPDISLVILLVMSFGGSFGAEIGSFFQNRISEKVVHKIFIVCLGLIIFISGYNLCSSVFMM